MEGNIVFLTGNTQQNDTYAGKEGQLTIDTERREIRLHDGITFGGHRFGSSATYSEFQTRLESLGISDVAGLEAAINGKVPQALIGAVSGVATLDNSGHIPAAQLPSFVDDVEEFDLLTDLPDVGEAGKLYVVKSNDQIYRWTGSAYYVISARIENSDDLIEGSSNLYYLPERVRAALSAQGDITLDMETGVFTIERTIDSVAGRTGDVVLTKDDVGLGNVDNFATATYEIARQVDSGIDFLTALGMRQSLEAINVFRLDSGWTLTNPKLPEYLYTEDGYILTTEDGVLLDFSV